jgi:hypothetical protein
MEFLGTPNGIGSSIDIQSLMLDLWKDFKFTNKIWQANIVILSTKPWKNYTFKTSTMKIICGTQMW